VAAAGLEADPGPEDRELARAGLGDPEPAVRATALGALHRLGALAGGDLEAAAADPSPVVRSRAAELAGSEGAAFVGLLAGLLADPSPTVVDAACFGLGEAANADAGAIAALSEVAGGHPDPLCRESAVAALGAIGDDRGRPAVLAAMGDKPAVRRRAVLALAAFDGPEVELALEKALSDRDWQVRQAAEDLTGQRGG
jgi:HEAT repeat protein